MIEHLSSTHMKGNEGGGRRELRTVILKNFRQPSCPTLGRVLIRSLQFRKWK